MAAGVLPVLSLNCPPFSRGVRKGNRDTEGLWKTTIWSKGAGPGLDGTDVLRFATADRLALLWSGHSDRCGAIRSGGRKRWPGVRRARLGGVVRQLNCWVL